MKSEKKENNEANKLRAKTPLSYAILILALFHRRWLLWFCIPENKMKSIFIFRILQFHRDAALMCH